MSDKNKTENYLISMPVYDYKDDFIKNRSTLDLRIDLL